MSTTHITPTTGRIVLYRGEGGRYRAKRSGQVEFARSCARHGPAHAGRTASHRSGSSGEGIPGIHRRHYDLITRPAGPGVQQQRENLNMSHTCIKCGTEEKCCYNEETSARLREHQHCFSCDFYWLFLNDPVKRPNRHHHSSAIVADGHIYTDGGNIESAGHDTRALGFGGHKWHFRMLDGSREWTSNNVWHGGEIPEVWRKDIPDNAEIIPAIAKGFRP